MSSDQSDGDGAELWRPLPKLGPVSDRIEQQIIGLMNDHELRTGDRIPAERELASRLGVSRQSVREALRSLQARGMVEIRHGQGVFIIDPAPPAGDRWHRIRDRKLTLTELFAMREVIDTTAAAWAADVHDLDLLALAQDALAQLNIEASRPAPSIPRLQRLDTDFHQRIAEAAGNRFLDLTYEMLQETIADCMETTLGIPGRLQQAQRDHDLIMKALLAGDVAAARRAAKSHVHGARDKALERMHAAESLAAGPVLPGE